MVDMYPDGTVRMVFFADIGGENVAPLTVKDLDAAEVLFMTCGLTPGRAAALRTKVARNKVASVDANLDEEVAAKFQYKRP